MLKKRIFERQYNILILRNLFDNTNDSNSLKEPFSGKLNWEVRSRKFSYEFMKKTSLTPGDYKTFFLEEFQMMRNILTQFVPPSQDSIYYAISFEPDFQTAQHEMYWIIRLLPHHWEGRAAAINFSNLRVDINIPSSEATKKARRTSKFVFCFKFLVLHYVKSYELWTRSDE